MGRKKDKKTETNMNNIILLFYLISKTIPNNFCIIINYVDNYVFVIYNFMLNDISHIIDHTLNGSYCRALIGSE